MHKNCWNKENVEFGPWGSVCPSVWKMEFPGTVRVQRGQDTSQPCFSSDVAWDTWNESIGLWAKWNYKCKRPIAGYTFHIHIYHYLWLLLLPCLFFVTGVIAGALSLHCSPPISVFLFSFFKILFYLFGRTEKSRGERERERERPAAVLHWCEASALQVGAGSLKQGPCAL